MTTAIVAMTIITALSIPISAVFQIRKEDTPFAWMSSVFGAVLILMLAFQRWHK